VFRCSLPMGRSRHSLRSHLSKGSAGCRSWSARGSLRSPLGCSTWPRARPRAQEQERATGQSAPEGRPARAHQPAVGTGSSPSQQKETIGGAGRAPEGRRALSPGQRSGAQKHPTRETSEAPHPPKSRTRNSYWPHPCVNSPRDRGHAKGVACCRGVVRPAGGRVRFRSAPCVFGLLRRGVQRIVFGSRRTILWVRVVSEGPPCGRVGRRHRSSGRPLHRRILLWILGSRGSAPSFSGWRRGSERRRRR